MLIIKESGINIKATFNALLILTAPLAIGLFFLLGCILSDSTSIISLIIYTLDAKNEKEKNATSAFNSKLTSKNLWAKMRGRNIKKFFTHW